MIHFLSSDVWAHIPLVQFDEMAFLFCVQYFGITYILLVLILILIVDVSAELLPHSSCFLHTSLRVLLLTLLYVR